jgi:hypothetical protein
MMLRGLGTKKKYRKAKRNENDKNAHVGFERESNCVIPGTE